MTTDKGVETPLANCAGPDTRQGSTWSLNAGSVLLQA